MQPSQHSPILVPRWGHIKHDQFLPLLGFIMTECEVVANRDLASILPVLERGVLLLK